MIESVCLFGHPSVSSPLLFRVSLSLPPELSAHSSVRLSLRTAGGSTLEYNCLDVLSEVSDSVDLEKEEKPDETSSSPPGEGRELWQVVVVDPTARAPSSRFATGRLQVIPIPRSKPEKDSNDDDDDDDDDSIESSFPLAFEVLAGVGSESDVVIGTFAVPLCMFEYFPFNSLAENCQEVVLSSISLFSDWANCRSVSKHLRRLGERQWSDRAARHLQCQPPFSVSRLNWRLYMRQRLIMARPEIYYRRLARSLNARLTELAEERDRLELLLSSSSPSAASLATTGLISAVKRMFNNEKSETDAAPSDASVASITPRAKLLNALDEMQEIVSQLERINGICLRIKSKSESVAAAKSEPPLVPLSEGLSWINPHDRWPSIPPLTFRQKHTQTYDPERNLLYLLGGEQHSFRSAHGINLLDIFNVDTGKVESLSLPDGMSGLTRHVSGFWNGILYSWGGHGRYEEYFAYDLLSFDVRAREWTVHNRSGSQAEIDAGTRPLPRGSMASCQIGSSLYVFGGRRGPRLFNDLWRLDLSSLQWERLVSHPELDFHVEHKIDGPYESEIDELTGLWRPRPPLAKGENKALRCQCRFCLTEPAPGSYPDGNPTPRTCPVLVNAHGDRLLLFGGGLWSKEAGWFERRNDVHVFDLKEKQWQHPSCRGEVPSVSSNCAYWTACGQLYLHGGGELETPVDGRGRVRDEMDVLDMITFEWKRLSPPHSQWRCGARDGHAATALRDNCSVIFIGGYYDNEIFILNSPSVTENNLNQ